MSIAINILSAVLKSLVNNKIGNELANELIGISIDEVSEKGINRINDFINGEKSKISHILSKENMESMNIPEENVDYVVAEIKDLLLKVKISDEVFRQCKYESMELSVYLLEEYRAYKDGYLECESDIKKVLFTVADALIKLMRDSEGFEKDFLIQISNSVDDTNAEIQKISEYLKENFSKLDDENQMMFDLLYMILEEMQKKNNQGNNERIINDEDIKFQNNKKEDYIKMWNSRLFLHQNNNERPITLADAFIMPEYIKREDTRRKTLFDNDTLDNVIVRFIDSKKSSTMLITGVPGIGKSTITSWIANQYKEDDRVIILRFRDWEVEELKKGLLRAIWKTLKCKKTDLECKILILDGFDELKTLDIRGKLLDTFFNDIRDFKNFKCIITSRPAYIQQAYYFGNVLQLKEFDIDKVEIFYRTITERRLEKKEKIESNLSVLGIPVILYMAIMSEIDISENPTKPELYNRIFAKEGGIFDKFYDGETEYSNGTQVLRSSENAKIYLLFLQQVAFRMFEKNRLYLLKGEYNTPKLEFQGKQVSVLEFPIRNLFEYAQSNIEFIHNSIYEYFVSEYIFFLINEAINGSKEELAGIFGDLLIYNMLSQEILEFMGFRIKNGKLKDMYEVVYEAFKLMLQDGMTYYAKGHYKNIIECEMRIFVNMLEIIHLWDDCYLVFNELLARYLRYNGNHRLNLKNMVLNLEKEYSRKFQYLREVNLSGANLEGSNLSNADLEGVNMRNTNLRGSDLRGVNLKRADLRKADLSFAKIQDIKLDEAILDGVILDQTQYEYLRNKYDLKKVIRMSYNILS